MSPLLTGHAGSISLEQLAQALDILELLQEKIAVLNGSVDRTILIPLLLSTSGTSCNITVKDLDTIEVGKSSSIGSTETIFKSIETLQSFFRDHLPQPVQASFFVKLNEKIVEILVSSTLAAVVPMDLSGLPTFQQTIEQVKSFATSLDKGSSQILLEWAEDAPNIWLAKRSEGSLNSIRQLLKRGLGRPRQVERVETQVVTQDDKVFSSNGNQEDWDTNWSDEDEQMKSQIKAPQKNRTPTVEEDDDMSGWGFDEDDDEVQSKVPDEAIKSSKKKNLNDEDDDDGEAWGWGDDPAVTKPTTRTSKPQEREITLRETYHITSLPEQILDIIVMIIEDANSLSHAK